MPNRLILVLFAISPALAVADEPQFVFAKPDDAKAPVEWKASAQGGVTYLAGNANSLTLSGGANASRFDGKNKVAVEVSGTYVRSTVRTGVDKNGNGVIDDSSEIVQEDKVTAEQWLTKARYDRFFTKNNSAYVTGFAGGDVPSGKDLFAGGQVGYSRQLWKDDTHTLNAELGYDMQYLEYVGTSSAPETQTYVGSGRALLGAVVEPPGSDTSIAASVEVLDNLSSVKNPAQPGGTVDAFADVRVNVRASVTTKIYGNINFRLSYAMKYDATPGPAPTLGIPYAKGFVPPAQTTDQVTEAALVVTFL